MILKGGILMYYAGIDLHKRFVQISVNDRSGHELANSKIACDNDQIVDFFSSFNDRPISSVIEATANWPWLVRLLGQQGIKVCLAHPLKTKAIASARIKTDSIDAKILADLLRADLIPKSYMANQEEQAQRDLIRFRIGLVRQKTKIKNRIHAVLAKQNIKHDKTDLFGKKGRLFLTELTRDDFLWLTPLEKMLIAENLSVIDFLVKKIKKVDRELRKQYQDNGNFKYLSTIPGFGLVTSSILLAEIGSVERFKDEKQLVGYIGLAPSVYSSGGKTRKGRITKLGNPIVRWALVQAAYRAIRKDPYLKDFYQRIAQRRDNKKAIVAVARKLLVSVYIILKRQEDYQFREIRPS
ncbi:MAG: IS110 family transposase [Patescibacteria group bacterium]